MDINTLIFSQERVSLSADESKIPWDNRCDISYTPTQRGILLFEAARDVLKKTREKMVYRQDAAEPSPGV
ncbi:hypothetical protein [Salmonella enterica]|uniref:hypothetical protein n=1 Tax=Salmonella enterica TaxID=28901 RepID=UPI0002B9EC34|nr:hypothetical protein [Salmonella enterica]